MTSLFSQGNPAKLIFVLAAGLAACGPVESDEDPSGSAGTDVTGDSVSRGPTVPRPGTQATSRVNAVWAVNDGEKVERDDLAHPAKASNSSWDGSTVHVFGGRNEVLAVQLIVESGTAGIGALQVSLPVLTRRGGTEKIVYKAPGADPTEYAARPIQIFTENYLQVTKPTSAGWIVKPGTPAAPADMTGWKPVQLVPENARAGKGGFPVAVAARQNQAVWFDIYVDRSLPAGIYDGTIRVQADGEVRQIPIALEVLGFTLPDRNAVDFMIYYESSQVTEYQGANLDAQYHRFAHRNRVEFAFAYDVSSATAHLGRFNGTDFKSAAGYEGPGQGVGNHIAPRSFWSPGSGWTTQSTARSQSDAWMTFLGSKLPGVRTLLYMPDEPSTSEYAEINTNAQNIHNNPGPGAALPIFVTHKYDSALGSSIDVWCSPSNNYVPSQALSERSQGDDMWYYNGQRPNVGALIIDSPATDARTHGWAAFKHGVAVYYYWHTNHWHHNSQAPAGYDRRQNVWAAPMTYNNGSSFANGDGVLVYPGQEKIHTQEDRGIAGPVSSIQMANLRRGAQDALYLSMARACGLTTLVDGALQAIVPHVLSEAGSTVSFPEKGDAYEAQRRKLGQALVSCPP